MVKTAISRLKFGKAASPSGVVVEMSRAGGDIGATMICDRAIAIIRDGKVPADSKQKLHSLPLQGKGICSGKRQL